MKKGFWTGSVAIVAIGLIWYFGYREILPWFSRFAMTETWQVEPPHRSDEEILYWTCPMHPSVKMPSAGRCPICGMDLTPVERTILPNSTPRGAEPVSTPVADPSIFSVDPARQRMMGLQTTPVAVRDLKKTIRTVGILEMDETRIHHVRTKIKGWIEDVFVNYTQQHVPNGAPLFSLYSPELVATQEEYLLAVRTAEELSSSPFQHVASGGRSLLDATRRRLAFFDMSEDQIRQLGETGQVRKSVIIHAPVAGHVMERNAFPNTYVNPETNLYTIVDHRYLWAQVEIYESDISDVREGQTARLTTVAYPGRVFQGKIAYLYPHMNARTRTMRARLEFPNPDLRLKPEMYADVEIDVYLGRRLSVPEKAVLRTGLRDVVFVQRAEGLIQLRKVALDSQVGDYYPVIRGLRLGERVVTSANFLIDSESRLRGIEAAWETPKPDRDSPHSMGHDHKNQEAGLP